MQHYYFDHNATTPVAPEVLRDLTETLVEICGNASSIHHFGQAAKQRLEASRREIAARIGSDPREIVFTSGGTESDNLAIFGIARKGLEKGAPGSGVRVRNHVITTVIVFLPLMIATTMLTESALSFLSIGVQPPDASWGTIISDGQGLLYTRPWVAIARSYQFIDSSDRPTSSSAPGRSGSAEDGCLRHTDRGLKGSIRMTQAGVRRRVPCRASRWRSGWSRSRRSS